MASYKSLEEIKPGMVVADPIRNNFGQVMMPKDFEIKENHLRLFKVWGISGVLVKDGNDDNDEELDPEKLKIAKEKLDSKMSWQCILPIENDLYNTAIKHLIKNG